MPRSVVSHISLLAVLAHLHVVDCAHHLPACERQEVPAVCHHGHHHHATDSPELPPDVPAHDDCHGSHMTAIVSHAAAAPSPDDAGAFVLPAVAITASGASCFESAVVFYRRQDPYTLPLRADMRMDVLLN
jgi:hypothetical protein